LRPSLIASRFSHADTNEVETVAFVATLLVLAPRAGTAAAKQNRNAAKPTDAFLRMEAKEALL